MTFGSRPAPPSQPVTGPSRCLADAEQPPEQRQELRLLLFGQRRRDLEFGLPDFRQRARQ